MTTKFGSIDNALSLCATIAGVENWEVRKAWKGREPTHIGWPQEQEAEKFRVKGSDFAIADFRDGVALWAIHPDGLFMFRY